MKLATRMESTDVASHFALRRSPVLGRMEESQDLDHLMIWPLLQCPSSPHLTSIAYAKHVILAVLEVQWHQILPYVRQRLWQRYTAMYLVMVMESWHVSVFAESSADGSVNLQWRKSPFSLTLNFEHQACSRRCYSELGCQTCLGPDRVFAARQRSSDTLSRILVQSLLD